MLQHVFFYGSEVFNLESGGECVLHYKDKAHPCSVVFSGNRSQHSTIHLYLSCLVIKLYM